MEHLEPTNMCTYWPAYPAFNPESVLLRRLFFMNEDGKNTCVCFRPARGYLSLVEIGVVREAAAPRPSSSATSKSMQWLRPFLCCATPRVAGTL